MEIVWLVCDEQMLLGVFADRGDAESGAVDVRGQPGATRKGDPAGAARTGRLLRDRTAHRQATNRGGSGAQGAPGSCASRMGFPHDPGHGNGAPFPSRHLPGGASENQLVFPAFQFNQSRELWPKFRDVLAVLRGAGWDDFKIMVWFVSHRGAADGLIPAVEIRADPQRVLSAARRSVADR